MLCSKCGCPMKEEDLFCHSCGYEKNRSAMERFESREIKSPDVNLPDISRYLRTNITKKELTMIPVAIIVASVVSSIITTVINFIIPILNQNYSASGSLGESLTIIASIVSSALYVVMIVLFSLYCKGSLKKLWFISSIYIGGIANILVVLSRFLLGFIMPKLPYTEISMQMMVFSLISAIMSLASLVVSIIVSIWFFKRLGNYRLKSDEDKIEGTPFRNRLLPCVFIVIYGVISLIYTLFSRENTVSLIDVSHDWDSMFNIGRTGVANYVITWVVLIGFAFILKGSYRKFAFVGSVVAGRGLVGVVNTLIDSVLDLVIPGKAWMFTGVVDVVVTVIAIAASIIIFKKLNQDELIKKFNN